MIYRQDSGSENVVLCAKQIWHLLQGIRQIIFVKYTAQYLEKWTSPSYSYSYCNSGRVNIVIVVTIYRIILKSYAIGIYFFWKMLKILYSNQHKNPEVFFNLVTDGQQITIYGKCNSFQTTAKTFLEKLFIMLWHNLHLKKHNIS